MSDAVRRGKAASQPPPPGALYALTADPALVEERPGLTVVCRDPAMRCRCGATGTTQHGLWGTGNGISVATLGEVDCWTCDACFRGVA